MFVAKRLGWPNADKLPAMVGGIKDSDTFWFCELYAVFAAFADEPTNVISRIGEGRISIPEDQANHLDHYRKCVLQAYPDAADLELITVVTRIAAILDNRSLGGEEFDESFWTNSGFMHHPEWGCIRRLAREYLIR
jgi:hypothetical protein